MVTLLISGSDTGIGKTRVVAALARVAVQVGRTVQIVKPVQTGIASGDPSDADIAAALAGLPPECAHTLRRYRAPLAPLAAASAECASLDIHQVLAEISSLPPADVRLIEGAGGIAVPLGSNGWDWVEFAEAARVNATVLVVADKLGAINQSRLVYNYYKCKYLEHPMGTVFLNALSPPPPEVAASTRSGLLACDITLWGELAADAQTPVLHKVLKHLLID